MAAWQSGLRKTDPLNNNRGNNNNNRRRSRGNGNGNGNGRPQGNGGGGGQQLNRIDSRARGNAPQLLEKYRKLAHDAHLNGDRVTAEYYLQFADHYFRVIADTRLRQEEARARREDRWQDNGEPFREEGEDPADFSVESDFPTFDQPVYTRREREEPRGDFRSDQRNEQRGEHRRREEQGQRDNRDGRDRDNRQRDSREHEPREQAAAPAESAEVQPEAESSVVYEPAENPFLRETRANRGVRPRREGREERPRRKAEPRADAEAPAAAVTRPSFDASSLPPSISAGRKSEAEVPAPAPVAAEPVAEVAVPAEKPKRPRAPRKTAAEKAAEAAAKAAEAEQIG
jgi:hypothetical protein